MEGERVRIVMHRRSRKTTRDPRIPRIPGRNTSGFQRPGRGVINEVTGAGDAETATTNVNMVGTQKMYRV